MKIAIIGGGWVGCHLALKLKDYNSVTIFEKNDSLFNETSFYNQNRLHFGFHYARNFETRELCKNTFYRFLNDYKFLTSDINKNLYCIPKKESLIDYKTYLEIFKNYEFTNYEINFNQVDFCINTNEKYINFKKAKIFFNDELKKIFVQKKIDNNQIKNLSKKYDLVVNCTNNNLKINKYDSFFELTISMLYRKNNEIDFDALTMVDGKLFSIYPYIDDLYTVTDVEYTPVKKFKSITFLEKYKKNIKESDIEKLKRLIEKKIIKYYPTFAFDFSFVGYFMSNKSKINDISDNRHPIISKENNIINCFTGKIQGIYIIEDYIKNLINK